MVRVAEHSSYSTQLFKTLFGGNQMNTKSDFKAIKEALNKHSHGQRWGDGGGVIKYELNRYHLKVLDGSYIRATLSFNHTGHTNGWSGTLKLVLLEGDGHKDTRINVKLTKDNFNFPIHYKEMIQHIYKHLHKVNKYFDRHTKMNYITPARHNLAPSFAEFHAASYGFVNKIADEQRQKKKNWQFKGPTDKKWYTTVQHKDGSLTCNCPTFESPPHSKFNSLKTGCKHTIMVRDGTADKECITAGVFGHPSCTVEHNYQCPKKHLFHEEPKMWVVTFKKPGNNHLEIGKAMGISVHEAFGIIMHDRYLINAVQEKDIPESKRK